MYSFLKAFLVLMKLLRLSQFYAPKFECHNRLTSYYCVILKMVILHDAIKKIQNGFLCFFKKRTKTCFFSKSKMFELKKQQTSGGLFF